MSADAAREMYYRISAKNGAEFKVSEKAVMKSETLGTMLNTMGEQTIEEIEKSEPIPLDNIDERTLSLVFKWCEKYKDAPEPVEDDSIPKNVVIPEYDEKLMQIDNEELFDLICAANYLNIKGLLSVSCKKVALMAKGKSPEELRVIYGIPTDEEDEAAAKKIREENEAKKAKEEAEKAKAKEEAKGEAKDEAKKDEKEESSSA